MPDFMRIGGVTGWLRAAAIAGAAGIPVSTRLSRGRRDVVAAAIELERGSNFAAILSRMDA